MSKPTNEKELHGKLDEIVARLAKIESTINQRPQKRQSLFYVVILVCLIAIGVSMIDPSHLRGVTNFFTHKESQDKFEQLFSQIKEEHIYLQEVIRQLQNQGETGELASPSACRTLVIYRQGKEYSYNGYKQQGCAITYTTLLKWINSIVITSPPLAKFYTSTGREVPPLIEFSISKADSAETPLVLVALKQNEQFMWPAQTLGDTVWLQVGNPPHKIGVKTIARQPRLFIIYNLLTSEECDHFYEFARKVEKSPSKVGADQKTSVESKARTSTHTWLGRRGLQPSQWHTDDIINNVEDRILDLLSLNGDTAEPFQVVWYNKSQYYYGHHDYTAKETAPHNPYYQGGGNRLVTVLLYLNDVEEGGETVFPFVDETGAPINRQIEPNNFYINNTACISGGVRVRPSKGGAVMFYNLVEDTHMDGTPDPYSLHAGCPVLKGEKFIINKWIRNKRVDGKLYDDSW